jgi:cation transport regulator ChaC
MADSREMMRLVSGEHALFGYGSLLSIESLERTLGRKYTGPFAVTGLSGWRRTWDVAMPDRRFRYQESDGEWVVPDRTLYLNIRPVEGSSINGVVFVVRDEELEAYDKREWIYDRVAVNDQLEDLRVEGGMAWAYVAKPEYLLEPPDSPRLGAVRQTYLDFLADGHRRLGAEFERRYYASTDAVPRHLVIDDKPQQ